MLLFCIKDSLFQNVELLANIFYMHLKCNLQIKTQWLLITFFPSKAWERFTVGRTGTAHQMKFYYVYMYIAYMCMYDSYVHKLATCELRVFLVNIFGRVG